MWRTRRTGGSRQSEPRPASRLAKRVCTVLDQEALLSAAAGRRYLPRVDSHVLAFLIETGDGSYIWDCAAAITLPLIAYLTRLEKPLKAIAISHPHVCARHGALCGRIRYTDPMSLTAASSSRPLSRGREVYVSHYISVRPTRSGSSACPISTKAMMSGGGAAKRSLAPESSSSNAEGASCPCAEQVIAGPVSNSQAFPRIKHIVLGQTGRTGAKGPADQADTGVGHPLHGRYANGHAHTTELYVHLVRAQHGALICMDTQCAVTSKLTLRPDPS